MSALLVLLSLNLWADPVILDDASVLEETARQQLLQQQISEFGRRLQTVRNNCNALLAPLPGPDNTTQPFSDSHTFITATMRAIKNEVPKACQEQLAQNLMTNDNPVGHRLAREILLSSLPLMASDMIFSCTPQTSPIQEILRFARGFQTNQGCKELNPGQWNIVNRSAAFYDTLSYGIQRLPDENGRRKYRAVLNLDFTTSNGTSVNSEQMLARVRQCLNGVQPFLKGQVNNGSGPQASSLRIDVLSGNEALRLPAAVRPRRNTVRIAPRGTRNTVRSFAENVSCDTIVHEVMHLLGLCDEYPGEVEGFPCRPVGRPTGLMRNEALAFASTIPIKLTCDCTSTLCRQITQTPVVRNYALQPGMTDYMNTDFRVRYCTGNEPVDSPLSLDLAVQQRPNRFTARASGNGIQIEYSEIEAAGNTAQVVTRSLSCTCPTVNGASDPECMERVAALTNDNTRSRMARNTMSCPAGSTPRNATPQPQFTSRDSVPPSNYIRERQVIELFSTPQQDTLFEPRHMNQIVNGNCQETAEGRQFGTIYYNNCSQLSYQRNLSTCQRQIDSGHQENRACLNRYNWGTPCRYGGTVATHEVSTQADFSYIQENSSAFRCQQ